MTDEELQQARKLVEAATPGPWTSLPWGVDTGPAFIKVEDDRGARVADAFDCTPWSDKQGGQNARFIAASRALVPQLLDEIERLRTTRDHSCACSINDGSAPLVKHDKNCPIRVNARKRIAPELALQRLGAALDSSDEADEASRGARSASGRTRCPK